MYDLSVGGEDGSGADLIVGGHRRGAPHAAHPHHQGNPHVTVQRIQPTNQTQVCSFPQGANGTLFVAAGATAILTARPQRPFQTERFVLPSTLSGFFAINDLVIGRDSMFVNSEAAHGDIFSQTGVGVALLGYIARPGIDITLTVTNIDTNDHPFYASIIGPAWV